VAGLDLQHVGKKRVAEANARVNLGVFYEQRSSLSADTGD
jgi:hypothetical protein